VVPLDDPLFALGGLGPLGDLFDLLEVVQSVASPFATHRQRGALQDRERPTLGSPRARASCRLAPFVAEERASGTPLARPS
jgi:hypothetical protein